VANGQDPQQPPKQYSPDNPFAQQAQQGGGKQYSADNPFAPQSGPKPVYGPGSLTRDVPGETAAKLQQRLPPAEAEEHMRRLQYATGSDLSDVPYGHGSAGLGALMGAAQMLGGPKEKGTFPEAGASFAEGFAPAMAFAPGLMAASPKSAIETARQGVGSLMQSGQQAAQGNPEAIGRLAMFAGGGLMGARAGAPTPMDALDRATQGMPEERAAAPEAPTQGPQRAPFMQPTARGIEPPGTSPMSAVPPAPVDATALSAMQQARTSATVSGLDPELEQMRESIRRARANVERGPQFRGVTAPEEAPGPAGGTVDQQMPDAIAAARDMLAMPRAGVRGPAPGAGAEEAGAGGAPQSAAGAGSILPSERIPPTAMPMETSGPGVPRSAEVARMRDPLSVEHGRELERQRAQFGMGEPDLSKTPPPEQSYAATHPEPTPRLPEGLAPVDIETARRGAQRLPPGQPFSPEAVEQIPPTHPVAGRIPSQMASAQERAAGGGEGVEFLARRMQPIIEKLNRQQPLTPGDIELVKQFRQAQGFGPLKPEDEASLLGGVQHAPAGEVQPVDLQLRGAGQGSFQYSFPEGGALEVQSRHGGVGAYRGALFGQEFTPELQARIEAAIRANHPEITHFLENDEPASIGKGGPGGGVTAFGIHKPGSGVFEPSEFQGARGRIAQRLTEPETGKPRLGSASGEGAEQAQLRLEKPFRQEKFFQGRVNIQPTEALRNAARESGQRWHVFDPDKPNSILDSFRSKNAAERVAVRNGLHIYDAKEDVINQVRKEAVRGPGTPGGTPPKHPFGPETGAATLGPLIPDAVAKAAEGLRDAWRSLVNPTARSPEAAETGLVLREAGARQVLGRQQLIERTRRVEAALDRVPAASHYDILDRYERGQPQASTAASRIAGLVRTFADESRAMVQKLGTGKLDHFLQNYIPHLFKDPTKAAEVFQQIRRSALPRRISGSGSFMFHRDLPFTLKDLHEQFGLEPVTTNPVELARMGYENAIRYTEGQKAINELTRRGLGRWASTPEEVPAGSVQVDDRAVGTPTEARSNIVAQRSHFYAPEPVAKVINNYLSPGLRGTSVKPFFELGRVFGNSIVQFRLGWSAFHGTMTTLLAVSNDVTAGLTRLASGHPIEGVMQMARAPLAPLRYFAAGSKLADAAFRGDIGGPMGQWIENTLKAGGRFRMEDYYRTGALPAFLKAWRSGSMLKAAGLSPFAATEVGMYPILGKYVPNLKLGAFMETARAELGKLGPGATDVQERAALSRAWDSIDNRFGQLVYDNLFWNRTLRDIGHISVQALGWNLGSVREAFGGVQDIARGNLRSTRAHFLLAYPATIALSGAILQYMLTGQGPQEQKDYFYPRTGKLTPEGEPERVQLPSYVRDAVSYAHDPVRTVESKAHPELRMASDIINNSDFQGGMIRNPDDPLVKQAQQTLEYMLRQYEPIALAPSIEHMINPSAAPQGSDLAQTLRTVGITPAPREMVRTPAMNAMEQFLSRKGPERTTPEEREERSGRRSLLQRITQPEERQRGLADLEQQVKDGKLTISQARTILTRSAYSPLVRGFKQLSLEEAGVVLQKANPEERRALLPYYALKMQGAATEGKADAVQSSQRLLQGLRQP
jgi:hypothetical protein